MRVSRVAMYLLPPVVVWVLFFGRPRVVVHDILGTPAMMGSTAVLHATQRVLDGLLHGPWPDDIAEDGGDDAYSPVVVVPAAVRIYVQVSPSACTLVSPVPSYLYTCA